MINWFQSLGAEAQLALVVAFFSAILGGVISTFSTLVLNLGAEKRQEKRDLENELKSQAFAAHRGFIKLLQYANICSSIKRSIDAGFEEAAENGYHDLEPCQKIRTLIGSEEKIEPFLAEDLVFLFKTKNSDLLGDLLVYQSRILGHLQVVRSYNTMREELLAIVEEEIIVSDMGADGTKFAAELDRKKDMRVKVRTGALNNILGNFMDHLERDEENGKEYLAKYAESARDRFKDKFPELVFEESNK